MDATPPDAVFRMAMMYPDRMNLYADRGNVLVLEQRCRRRGIAFEIVNVAVGESFDGSRVELIYLGGGQDRDQRSCGVDLLRHRDELATAAVRGATVLGICGGFQLLGHEYATPDGTVIGLGLLDAVTVRTDGPRLVGNVVVDRLAMDNVDSGRRTLVGFENHQGRTELGPGCRPLGTVVVGHGNNDRDGTEGAVAGAVMGTYLHGPLLAKNTWFADQLIERAVGFPLPPLEDRFGESVHTRAVAAALATR